MNEYMPETCHEVILREMRPALSYYPGLEYEAWRKEVGVTLRRLLGDMPQKSPLNLVIEWERERETCTEIRFSFDAEQNCRVPCHLLVPRLGKKRYPVIICLQGHSMGMHVSLGVEKYPDDSVELETDCFAPQIIAQGYAALVMEQRGFGERATDKTQERNRRCNHPAMTALLIGRTLLGERVYDVMRAIDALEQFSQIDGDKIGCLGNSGGGTVTYYAACLDERIKIAMPSCSVCTFSDSIGTIQHCVCNYIPGIAKYFDMGDLACLIAPRPLLVAAGDKDHIFPIDGVKKAFAVIENIYEQAGCKQNCRLVIGNGGHRFYPAWDDFRELADW